MNAPILQSFSVDCVSPLISYSPPGAWRLVTPNDPDYSSYANYSTGMITGAKQQNQDGQMVFSFSGTFVSVYGSKRPTHGIYQVSVDGGPSQDFDGFHQDSVSQFLLFNATLPDGNHTVRINSVGNEDHPNRTAFDVDWISWERPMPIPSIDPASTDANNSTIGVQLATYGVDNSTSFQYLPSDSWPFDVDVLNPSNPQPPTRSTKVPGAELVFSFAVPNASVSGGGSVAVEGPISLFKATQANFSASLKSSNGTVIDDRSMGVSFDGVHSQTGNQLPSGSSVNGITLYMFEGLPPGDNYTLSLAYNDSLKTLSVSKVRTWLTGTSAILPPSDNGTSSSDPGSSQIPGSSGPGGSSGSLSAGVHSTPVGAIVGGVIGGLVALALIAVIGVHYRRKLHRQRQFDYYRTATMRHLEAGHGSPEKSEQ